MLKYTTLQIKSVLNATWYSTPGKEEVFRESEFVELCKSLSLSRLSVSLWGRRLWDGALRKNRANVVSIVQTVQRGLSESEVLDENDSIIKLTVASRCQRKLLSVDAQYYQLPVRMTCTPDWSPVNDTKHVWCLTDNIKAVSHVKHVASAVHIAVCLKRKTRPGLSVARDE